MKYIKLFENIDFSTIIPKKKWLYHVSNIKNLASIQKYGLLPEWGDTVRHAYRDTYDFDNKEKEFSNYYDEDGDESENEEDRLIKLEMEGIVFLSPEPQIMYAHFVDMSKFNWNEIVIAVVKNNESIYQKADDEEYLDYKGNSVGSIKHNWSYTDIYSLPRLIETTDYFSFEMQKPKYVFHGKQAEEFVTKYFPNQLKKIRRH